MRIGEVKYIGKGLNSKNDQLGVEFDVKVIPK